MISYQEITTLLIKKDARFKIISEASKSAIHPTPSIDIYYYLLNSIVSQQLSVKVAEIIWKRFLDLFPDQYPSEDLVLQKTDEELRAVGLSFQKLGYLKNVADFSKSKGMLFEQLAELSDEAIIDYLTEIKGVGKWTVQMVLMFPMDRPDVFPVDDLGIQTKMKSFYKLNSTKKDLKDEMLKIADNWKPYRTLASKLLWNAQ